MAKRIMVVDDEENILALVTAILEGEGYSVTTASNGEDCLKKLRTDKPDLVLLDMMMPGMSGREVCERIRKAPETKNLRVAFLTVAKFSDAGRDVLKKMNVLDYITKPFENDDLVDRVRKMLAK